MGQKFIIFFGTTARVHVSSLLSAFTYLVKTSSICLSTNEGRWCLLHSVAVVFEEDSLLKLVFRISAFKRMAQ